MQKNSRVAASNCQKLARLQLRRSGAQRRTTIWAVRPPTATQGHTRPGSKTTADPESSTETAAREYGKRFLRRMAARPAASSRIQRRRRPAAYHGSTRRRLIPIASQTQICGSVCWSAARLAGPRPLSAGASAVFPFILIDTSGASRSSSPAMPTRVNSAYRRA